MDCGCNCFGIASSSRFPVKRYNLLVPDIFPKKNPDVSPKVEAFNERKYKKLTEYVEKNPHRGPKASRRLARRINQELQAHHDGYVQVAAQAFVHLLQHLPAEDSSLFARELVAQHVDKEKGRLTKDPLQADNSVIGVLLRAEYLEARIWGAQLLAAYVQTQGSLEFAQQLEVLVGYLLPCIRAQSSNLHGGDDGSQKGALVRMQVAALAALREYILYCGRVYASKKAQRDAAETVMDVLLKQTAPGSAMPCKELPSPDADTALGEQQGKPEPITAAMSCMDALFNLCQDAVESKQFINQVFNFIDKRGAWKTRPEACIVAVRRMQQVCKKEGQDSLVFSALLKHIRKQKEGSPQQTMLLQEAARQASGLPASFAVPALISALQELPAAMPKPQQAPIVKKGSPKAAAAGGPSPLAAAKAEEAGAAAAKTEADAAAKGLSAAGPSQEKPAGPGTKDSILALISGIAKRAGSSALVLEVLGGVCGHFSAEKLAQGTKTVTQGDVMACFQAALLGSADALRAQGPSFPQALTDHFVTLMDGTDAAQRTSAMLLTTAALQQVDGQLPDAQTQKLLLAAWQEAAAAGGTPASIAALDALLECLIRTAGLPAKVSILQWATSLRYQILTQADGGHFKVPGRAQQLVLLYVYNAVLLRLAPALGSPKLPELRLQLLAAECPRMRLDARGLQAAAKDSKFIGEDNVAAGKVLQRLRAKEVAIGNAATKAAGALSETSALRGRPQATAYLEQLRKPFGAANSTSLTAADPKASQAEMVKRLEAIFPDGTAAKAQAPAPTAARATLPIDIDIQNDVIPEQGADGNGSGAAMQDLLYALNAAMQNGAEEGVAAGAGAHDQQPYWCAAPVPQPRSIMAS